MIRESTKGAIYSNKKRTQTAAFLAAVLLLLTTLMQGMVSFVNTVFAASETIYSEDFSSGTFESELEVAGLATPSDRPV